MACRRQAAWARSRARSRCRLDHIFSTTAWSSAVTVLRDGERSAAMATDRASFGSFLFELPGVSEILCEGVISKRQCRRSRG